MNTTIEAVYENGVFKPLQPVQLEEGQRVQVTFPMPPPKPVEGETPQEMLRRLGWGLFADIPDEDWQEISQSWRRA